MSAAANVRTTPPSPPFLPHAQPSRAASGVGGTGTPRRANVPRDSALPAFARSADGAPAPRAPGRQASGTLDVLLRTTRRVATVGLGTSALGLGVYAGLPVLLPGLIAVGRIGKLAVLAASWACVVGACTFFAAAAAWALLRLGQAAHALAKGPRATAPLAGASRPPVVPRPRAARAAPGEPADAPGPRGPDGNAPRPPAPKRADTPARAPQDPAGPPAAAAVLVADATQPSAVAPASVAAAPAPANDVHAAERTPASPMGGFDGSAENASPSLDGTEAGPSSSSAPASEATSPSPSRLASSRPPSPVATALGQRGRSPLLTPPLASPAGSSLQGTGTPPEASPVARPTTPTTTPRSQTSGNTPGGASGSGSGSGSDEASAQAFHTPLTELSHDGVPSAGFAFAAHAPDFDPEAEQLAEDNAQLRLEVEDLTSQLAEQRAQAAADAAAQRREVTALRARLEATNAQLATLEADRGRVEADSLVQAAGRDELRAELADLHAEYDALLRERQDVAQQGTAAERRRLAQRQRARETERDAERELVAQLTGRLHELERRSKFQADELTTLRARKRRQDDVLAERDAQIDELERCLDVSRKKPIRR